MAKVGHSLVLILPCVAWADGSVATQIEAIEAKLAATTVPAQSLPSAKTGLQPPMFDISAVPSPTTAQTATLGQDDAGTVAKPLMPDEDTHPIALLDRSYVMPQTQLVPVVPTATQEAVQTTGVQDSLSVPPNPIKQLHHSLFKGGVPSVRLVPQILVAKPAPPTKNGTALTQQQDFLVSDGLWQTADDNKEPYQNIKNALLSFEIGGAQSFRVILPRLRQTVQEAAQAVGYYDVGFDLVHQGGNRVQVLIERLGEPVRVGRDVFELRGEGASLEEFYVLQKNAPTQGQVFHQGKYDGLVASVQNLKRDKGFFEGEWLDKSAEVLLPDNEVDLSLVYDTKKRYRFDKVVFFTLDKDTGLPTTDPKKLPVELPLLQKLVEFAPNDGFDQAKINKLSNDLLTTRYFDGTNVEAVLPDNRPSLPELPSQAPVVAPLSEGQEALIAPIDFGTSDALLAKLARVKDKAEDLYQSPNDVLLTTQNARRGSLLGRVSEQVSKLLSSLLPDESYDNERLRLSESVPLADKKTPQEVYDDKKVPLYVFVAADKVKDANLALGYGSDTGVRASTRFENHLVNRLGTQLGVQLSYSKTDKDLAAYVSHPLSHPINDKLFFNAKYREENLKSLGGFNARTLEAGIFRNVQGSTGWNKSYGLRYHLDKLTERAVNDSELPVEFDEGNPTQSALLASLGLSKLWQNDPAEPTQGLRQAYSVELGSRRTGGANMSIVRGLVGGMTSFGDNAYGKNRAHQWVGRLEAGYLLTDDFSKVPYKLRFFAGGDQSVRGYNSRSLSPISKKGNPIGGQALLTASAEYSYELKKGLRAAIFADAGGAYDRNFRTKTKVGAGVGIRFASPVGTVRVDIAKGIERQKTAIRLHFLIGLPF